MNMKTMTLTGSLILSSAVFSYTSRASDNIDFHFSALGEYDSSVGLSELDSFTREGDSALLLKGGLKGHWQSEDKLSFTSLYKFTHRNYQVQNAYDQNLHHVAIQPQFHFGDWKAGWRHDSVFASLAGESFMDYQLNALSVEGSFASGFYLRLARNLADKELENHAERNAEISTWSGDLFWFSDSGQHVLAVSSKTGEEDARVAQHDFDIQQWKIGYTHKFSINAFASKWKLSHGLQIRDYPFVYPEDNTQFLNGSSDQRRDKKITTEISLESKLNKYFSFVASLEFVNNNSNLTSVDYQEDITSVGLRVDI